MSTPPSPHRPPGVGGPPPASATSPASPGKKRIGLVLGIAAGSLAVLAVLAWAGKHGLDALSAAGGSYPAAEYRLTAPPTLLGGAYKLRGDSSGREGKGLEAEDRKDPTVRLTAAVVATYAGEPGSALVVSGFYGQIKNPGPTREQILDGGATSPGTTLVVPPKEFRPAGFDVTVSCQVTRSTAAGRTSTVPMCAWGDGNTASFVALVTPEVSARDPRTVDLRKLAGTTAAVRAEMRAPLS